MPSATTESTQREAVPREEVAQRVQPLLSEDTPLSAAAIGRELDLDARTAMSGLRVLEARHQAKNTRRGWVTFESTEQQQTAPVQLVDFPYKFSVPPFEALFVDPDYQRPLTSFVRKIEAHFDPVLFGTLVLNDRIGGSIQTDEHGFEVADGRRYAVIDGQTRWVAAGRIGIQRGPSIVFQGLTPEQEASIFWRLQTGRKNVVSYHRFRAQLASGNEESHAILKVAKDAGYTIGEGSDKLKAVAALETCYRTDDYLLERTLIDLKAAWPDRIPEGPMIRGMHFFFRNFPVDKPNVHEEVDDEQLVRRLKTAGLDGLERKKVAAKELGTGQGAKLTALAIQAVYLSATAKPKS